MKIVLLLFSSFFALYVFGQYPEDGAMLNHRQVMLEYPQVKGASYYHIEVQEAKKNKVIYSVKDPSTAHLVALLLDYGKSYQWRVEAWFENRKIATSPWYYFALAQEPEFIRNTIVTYDSAVAMPGLVCTDYGVVLNRKGEVVMFANAIGENIRNFKMGTDGYFTFVTDGIGTCNLNGNILWKKKEIIHGKDTIGNFHHQFHRLASGSYIALATRKKKLDQTQEQTRDLIVEMDAGGKVTRIWDEERHNPFKLDVSSFHINSIALDPDGAHYLISCRDINSVIKINRQTGRIVYVIGKSIGDTVPLVSTESFALQHAASFTKQGDILLFNNGLRKRQGAQSTIQIFEQPVPGSEAKLKWEYPFNFASPEENYSIKTGSVQQLPNGNLLIAQGVWNRNFEVTPDKKIVWECLTEQRVDTTKQWLKQGSFSVNYISSLFPCYFTAVATGDNNVLITNEGTETDTYLVELIEEKTGKKLGDATYTLEPGKFVNYRQLSARAGCVVHITSSLDQINKKVVAP